MAASPAKLLMKDGTPYAIGPCVAPGTRFTAEHLQRQITLALHAMSDDSRRLRFASSIRDLPKPHLDHLTDLDGRNRVAWCATVGRNRELRGIGLSRYIRLPDETAIAEFAVTVVDEFQGQGVGRQLMDRLVESARDNAIDRLRGYVLPDNDRMLGLCRHYDAVLGRDPDFIEISIRIR